MLEQNQVLAYLDRLEIQYTVDSHPAVYTMDEMERLGLCEKGMVCKNLFLRDTKGQRHFLVLTTKEKQIQLAQMQEAIGSTKLSFASEERLDRHLKLTKGAVTPFGLINNTGSTVEVVIDRDLSQYDPLGFHPNVNTATVWITYGDLMRFIESRGNTYQIVSLP